MGGVLSVDLASKFARDFGVCLLKEGVSKSIDVSFIDPGEIGIIDPLEAEACAGGILSYCKDNDIHLIILDGPQGWMDPTRADATYRYCEKLTRAPAKTGIVGQVKPRNYKGFVEFSISVFQKLHRLGAVLLKSPRINRPRHGLLVLESFPTSAWRRLCLAPLPGKRKAKSEDVSCRLRLLKKLYKFECPEGVSHDNLQALVAGLAGVAILEGNAGGYVAEGLPAVIRDGIVMEGFIVNPR